MWNAGAASKILKASNRPERSSRYELPVNQVPDPIVPGNFWGHRNDANASIVYLSGEIGAHTYDVCVHMSEFGTLFVYRREPSSLLSWRTSKTSIDTRYATLWHAHPLDMDIALPQTRACCSQTEVTPNLSHRMSLCHVMMVFSGSLVLEA